MPNYSNYSQPTNPWTLAVKSKSSNSKNNSRKNDNKKEKKQENYEYNSTFMTATALIFDQMLSGKSGQNLINSSSSDAVSSTTSKSQTNHASSQRINHNNTQNLPDYQPFQPNYNTQTKRLGLTHVVRKQNDGQCNSNYKSHSQPQSYSQPTNSSGKTGNSQMSAELIEIIADERAKNLDHYICEKILNEIIDQKAGLTWDQIGGLDKIKSEIEEIVIWPMERPDLFVDLLSPCKGLLLYGPPGTGKTLIGKCIASQSKSTFFSISASSLTSKWIGEAEKLVKALFVIARIKQPSVIFIDEIDSLLTQRSETEHESSRRIKTEFLVQFDGITSDTNDNLLIIGATNLPHSLDDAVKRRFTKRLYVPLPKLRARKEIINLLLKNQKHNLDKKVFLKLCRLTKGYSGADLAQLCKDAALNIVRRNGKSLMQIKNKDDLPPITIEDFLNAIKRVRPSVSSQDLTVFEEWNKTFGSVQYKNDKNDDEDEEEDGDDFEEKSMDCDDSLVVLN